MNPTNHLVRFKPRSADCSTRMCRSDGPEKDSLKTPFSDSRRLGEAESKLYKLGLEADKVRVLKNVLEYVVATGCI